MSNLSAECRISSVFQKEGQHRTGFFFFRNAPKTFSVNSLLCILQALPVHSGDEIKAHVRDVRGGGAYGGKKIAYRVLVGKPEGKKQLKRIRRG